jgi:hypothetical protein
LNTCRNPNMTTEKSELRLLNAKLYLQGKPLSKALSSLTANDIRFVMNGLGSGCDPESLAAGIKAATTNPSNLVLSPEQSTVVATAGGTTLQLYSFLRDPVQQRAWKIDPNFVMELLSMEGSGKTHQAVLRLGSWLEETKEERGGRVAKVVPGNPPKGRKKSAISEMVMANCSPKERSKVIHVVEDPADHFTSREKYYVLRGRVRKDVENAGRLAAASKIEALTDSIRASGVSVEKVAAPIVTKSSAHGWTNPLGDSGTSEGKTDTEIAEKAGELKL